MGSGRVEKTLAMLFSADETSDGPYQARLTNNARCADREQALTGAVQIVVIETDTKENVDHLISHEELLHILMARQ